MKENEEIFDRERRRREQQDAKKRDEEEAFDTFAPLRRNNSFRSPGTNHHPGVYYAQAIAKIGKERRIARELNINYNDEYEETVNRKNVLYGRKRVKPATAFGFEVVDDLSPSDSEFSVERRTVMNGIRLSNAFTSLGDMIVEYLDKFIDAQTGKIANINDALSKGPKDYQNFMKAVFEFSKKYKQENGYTVAEITRDMDKIFDMAKLYVKEHKPRIRGHRTKESAERYELMKQFVDSSRPIIRTVNSIGNELNNDLKKTELIGKRLLSMKLSDLTAKGLNSPQLLKAMDKHKVNFDDIYNMDKQELDDTVKRDIDQERIKISLNIIKEATKDNVFIEVDKAYFAEQIRDNAIMGDADHPVIEDGDNVYVIDRAIQFKTNAVIMEDANNLTLKESIEAYVAAKYVDMVKKVGSEDGISTEELVNKCTKANIIADMKKLSNDKVFKRLVTLDDKFGFREYDDLLERADKEIKKSEERLNKLKKSDEEFLNNKATLDERFISNVAFLVLTANPKSKGLLADITVPECVGINRKPFASAAMDGMNSFLNSSGIMKSMKGQSINKLPKLIEKLQSKYDKLHQSAYNSLEKAFSKNQDAIKKQAEAYNKRSERLNRIEKMEKAAKEAREKIKEYDEFIKDYKDDLKVTPEQKELFDDIKDKNESIEEHKKQIEFLKSQIKLYELAASGDAEALKKLEDNTEEAYNANVKLLEDYESSLEKNQDDLKQLLKSKKYLDQEKKIAKKGLEEYQELKAAAKKKIDDYKVAKKRYDKRIKIREEIKNKEAKKEADKNKTGENAKKNDPKKKGKEASKGRGK